MPSKTESGTLGSARSTKPVALAVYVLGAFLTYGHVFNSLYVEPRQTCGPQPDIVDKSDAWDQWYWCRNPRFVETTAGAFPPSLFAGIAWPIYWGGHFAIKVTK